jgi:hypothetical protein
MTKDRLWLMAMGRIMPAVKREVSIDSGIRNFHDKGDNMTTRKDRGRRLSRPAAGVLARPRELFGESLPELLLLTAVVATVVSAVFALSAG